MTITVCHLPAQAEYTHDNAKSANGFCVGNQLARPPAEVPLNMALVLDARVIIASSQWDGIDAMRAVQMARFTCFHVDEGTEVNAGVWLPFAVRCFRCRRGGHVIDWK